MGRTYIKTPLEYMDVNNLLIVTEEHPGSVIVMLPASVLRTHEQTALAYMNSQAELRTYYEAAYREQFPEEQK